MPAKCFFDTSILVYLVAQNDQRSVIAERLVTTGGYISVHVLNELVAVVRRKLGLSWKEVPELTSVIRILCEDPLPLTVALHDEAVQIAQRYKYHIDDALVIAAAVQSGCRLLYTEDRQHGQSIGSLRIENPFLRP